MEEDNLTREIDEGAGYTSFDEALRLVRENTPPVGIEKRSLAECSGFVCAEDVFAVVNNPPRNASMKDGFAVISSDVSRASNEDPCELKIVGSAFAGGMVTTVLASGQTIRVCTGAPIPEGADAIIADELCEEVDSERIIIKSALKPGQNISPIGENVSNGMKVAEIGQVLLPASLALIAVAGIDRVPVFRKPRFALLSIGDEVIEPGTTLKEGQIYASNLVYNSAWMEQSCIPYRTALSRDDAGQIREKLEELLPGSDALITSGGVMHSERDLIVSVLESLGWDMKFRHVRMGPGKATAFGLLDRKPVFCFSGGPNSNTLSFLEFALAGIRGMAGLTGESLKTITAILGEDIVTRNINWTEFREATFSQNEKGDLFVTPVSKTGRSVSMAKAECLIIKPEGIASLEKGQKVTVQVIPGMVGTGLG